MLVQPITRPCAAVRALQGKIKSLEQIYLFSMPVKEYQIVEYFLGSALKDEVMKIMPVQKQTRAGQRTRFKVRTGSGAAAAACMQRPRAVSHPRSLQEVAVSCGASRHWRSWPAFTSACMHAPWRWQPVASMRLMLEALAGVSGFAPRYAWQPAVAAQGTLAGLKACKQHARAACISVHHGHQRAMQRALRSRPLSDTAAWFLFRRMPQSWSAHACPCAGCNLPSTAVSSSR